MKLFSKVKTPFTWEMLYNCVTSGESLNMCIWTFNFLTGKVSQMPVYPSHVIFNIIYMNSIIDAKVLCKF